MLHTLRTGLLLASALCCTPSRDTEIRDGIDTSVGNQCRADCARQPNSKTAPACVAIERKLAIAGTERQARTRPSRSRSGWRSVGRRRWREASPLRPLRRLAPPGSFGNARPLALRGDRGARRAEPTDAPPHRRWCRRNMHNMIAITVRQKTYAGPTRRGRACNHRHRTQLAELVRTAKYIP
ncbi:hypothetical protein BD310DRAFT_418376 [Dichomitus squalens]|uniref:Secreted protein n=1 Tax=Dichomitus squalens TaxID=114155 RepID=A0A4Q9PXC3_9APHY|nr:hypothetical protein BD310DRAFT_418376 [Dichomitus squalens]